MVEYKVGDKVVLIGSCSDWSNGVKEIQEIRGKLAITLNFDYSLTFNNIRHATPEEIQAGRRLEVCGVNK